MGDLFIFLFLGRGGVATRKCIWRNQAVLARSTLHSKYKKNEEGVEKVGSVGLISGLAQTAGNGLGLHLI